MKRSARTFSGGIVLAALAFPLAGDLPAETPKPAPEKSEAAPDFEIRVLPRTRPDRLYQLSIGLPPSFRDHRERKYPVIFVADGYWGWPTVRNICGGLLYGKHLPEVLVVGLGYAGEHPDYGQLRVDDLAPLSEVGFPGESGHANKFLELIETTVIPLLEREYRADPEHRYLVGSSAGGLFGVYALLTKPDLFQGIVADSPSVGVLWNMEREFAGAKRTTSARVYISVAENEPTAYRQGIEVFYRRMAAHDYVQGGLKFRRIEGVRHSAGTAESYLQGLLFVAAPIAPEHGVQTDMLTDPAGRPGFGVDFRPATRWETTPAADRDRAWREHTAYLAQLAGAKRIEFAGVLPGDVERRDSSFMMFARERNEVVAVAEADPTVKAGLLAYEVISGSE